MKAIHHTTAPTYQQAIFLFALLLCFMPFIDAPIALLMGFLIAQTVGHPFLHLNHKATQWLLKISVVGLGFGMNLHHAIAAGKEGFFFTIFSIITTLLTGLWLGKRLGIDKKTAFLIASGTAICGGSAIAAVSPLVKANEKQISVALGAVFVLNAIALFIFPVVGQWLNMPQHTFGLWCAIAIHDTSSVVGASAKYGAEALQIATTVKLERALWIIPLSIITTLVYKSEGKKIQLPYFIGLFILAMLASSYYPEYGFIYQHFVHFSKKGLALTLFLIGAGLNLETIKAVGIKPFLQGIILWIFISVLSLIALIFLGF